MSDNPILSDQRPDSARLERYIEASNRNYDARRSSAYRQRDEAALAPGRPSAHYAEVIRRLSLGFDRKIDVLDVGCGSGRFFHSLANVRRLVGLDPSAQMLEQARDPVRKERLDAEVMELICGDVFSLGNEVEAFDLIYSIGVLGEFAPIDATLLERLAALLKPDGVLYTTAVDAHSRMRMRVDGRMTLFRRGLNRVFRHLPRGLRAMLNRSLSPCYVTREHLEAMFATSKFRSYSLGSYVHREGWKGTHFECLAYKSRNSAPQSASFGSP
jgi:SAM-dependent methyltransferase